MRGGRRGCRHRGLCGFSNSRPDRIGALDDQQQDLALHFRTVGGRLLQVEHQTGPFAALRDTADTGDSGDNGDNGNNGNNRNKPND